MNAPTKSLSVYERLRAELDRHLAGSSEPITSVTRVREIKAYAELLRGSGRLKAESYFVASEPPFAEFVHLDLNDLDRYCFDLRAPTLTTPWERFVHRLRGSPLVEISWRPPEAKRREPLAFLRVRTSKEDRVDLQNALQFLRALTEPVSFEIVGDVDELVMQFVCAETYARTLASLLQSHYEVSEFERAEEDALGWVADEDVPLNVAEFALNTSHVVPLQTLGGFGVEPMQVLMGVFDDLDFDEAGALQILFEPCDRPWETNLKKAILDELTQEPIMKEPDLPSCLRRKIASPFFAVSVRIVGTTEGLLDRFLGYVNQFSTEHNRLVPLDDLPASELTVRGVAERMVWRPGMLWNAEELASFVHLPPESVFSDKMTRVKLAKRPAPPELLGVEGVLLGENLYHNRRASVRIPSALLNRHMLIAGSTRMGKSTLMGNMLASLVRQGKGVFVIDPKGSLAKTVAAAIPPEFVEKTVYFNPADRDHPIAMNLMRFAKHYDRQELINDIVRILDSVTVALTAATPRMWELFSNAMRFFLKRAETDATITLRNVRDFFHDAAYRRRMVGEMEHPVERAYWEAYERDRSGSRQPDTSAMGLTSRLAQLTDYPTLANILCAPECRIDFREIFHEEGIFIADLGEVGELRKNFLGRLLVAEAQLSCMARPASERTDVFFFMDEFQQYQTSAFDTVLAQGAEYRMNMALAHQNAAQVEVKTMQSVLGNVGTIVAFWVGEDYAARLSRSFGGAWESKAFLSLPEYECLARVGTAHFSLRSYSREEYAEIEGLSEVPDSYSAVVENTRERYSWREDDAPTAEPGVADSGDDADSEYRPTRTESEFFSTVDEFIHITLSSSLGLEEKDAPPIYVADETASNQLTLLFDESNMGNPNAATWRCPICGEEFPRNPGGNARHFRACRERNDGECPVACPQCGRRFKTVQGMRSHIGRAHRNHG